MTKVTLIAVTIQMSSRWSVGGVAVADEAVKLPVVVDPRGGTIRPWLPGASVAGSLRHHFGDQADRWLGPEPGGYEQITGDKQRVASPLWILGCIGCNKVEVGYSGSTRINEARGAAESGSLRTQQWAGPTEITIACECSGATPELVDLLATWRPVFGRGRSAGLGQGRVRKVRAATLDLSVEDQLRWWLTSRQQWYRAEASAPVEEICRDPDDTDDAAGIELEVREPVRIGDGAKDRVLTILRVGDNAVIPGSSWKGIFRHRIAVILDALGAPDREEICQRIFGSTEYGRGRLSFGESYVTDPRLIRHTHVAIDRVTGGARDGALFTTESLAPGTRLSLTIRWDDHPVLPPAVSNLVAHVLRDLHEGLVSVGGMGSRGYGWVQLVHPMPDLQAVDVNELRTELEAHHAR